MNPLPGEVAHPSRARPSPSAGLGRFRTLCAMATPALPRRPSQPPQPPGPPGPGASLAERTTGRWAWGGLVAALLLVVAASALPPLLGWDVHARDDDRGTPPTHGFLDPGVGIGTVPALVLAVLAWRYAADLAERLPWRRLLLVSFVAGLAWMLALALVDGPSGLTRVLGNPYEYLPTARDVDSVPTMLSEFVDRIPYSHPDNWVVHVAGHPPLALLFFVGLVRVGLGGDLAAALVVVVMAATTAVAVLVALRALGAEAAARRVAPLLVLAPTAVYMAVSADAAFAAVAAWGLAALALGATARSRGRSTRVAVAWSALAGLLLGCCVLLSYGLPLLGVLALTILLLARSWLPLPVAVVAALVPVLAMAVGGFAWWEAYPVLHDRYFDGLGGERSLAYWSWGNLAALLFATGPLLGAGVARLVQLGATRRGREVVAASAERVVAGLAAAGVATILLADLSGMSKAEVERIWLPFMPWLLLCLALLPARWRRWGLALQLASALLVQHLLYTSW